MNSDFYDFAVRGLDGSEDLLGALRGQVALVVNVASKCGYTSQYAALQQLYEELQDQRFCVIGFPCNQFGAQEPGTSAEIQSFCSQNFGVTFPLAAKNRRQRRCAGSSVCLVDRRRQWLPRRDRLELRKISDRQKRPRCRPISIGHQAHGCDPFAGK